MVVNKTLQGTKNEMTKLQHLLHTFCKPQTVKTSILTILFVALCAPLFAQTVNTIGTSVFYTNGYQAEDDNATVAQDKALYCNGWMNGGKLTAWPSGTATDDRSFVVDAITNPSSNATQHDPWVSSALIEYDQPYPAPTEENSYPNHCLGLCASFSCSNLPVGQTTYSVSFPLQRITFDIFKYYNGKNPKTRTKFLLSVPLMFSQRKTLATRANILVVLIVAPTLVKMIQKIPEFPNV